MLLGNAAVQHPRVRAHRQAGAGNRRGDAARFGLIGEAANSVGGYLARAVPSGGGLDARAMLEQPRKLYLLLNVEPRLDHAHDPRWRMAALSQAESVIAVERLPARPNCSSYADVPAADRAVHRDRRHLRQLPRAACRGSTAWLSPAGEARPAWKVLRVLGNLLGLAGFDYDSTEAGACRGRCAGRRRSGSTTRCHDECADAARAAPASPRALLSVSPTCRSTPPTPLVRRAVSLQKTSDARSARARAVARRSRSSVSRRATRCARRSRARHRRRGDARARARRRAGRRRGAHRRRAARNGRAGVRMSARSRSRSA